MIALRLLGPAAVSVDGRPAAAELLWRKNLALLIYLARSPRHTRTREHLMGLLWGDKPETAARHSLREAMRAIRQAGGEHTLETAGDQVRLHPGAVTVDVDDLDRCATAGHWQAAAELVTGEFLEGFSVPDAPSFEDWLGIERLAVRTRCVDALVQYAVQRQQAGDLGTSGALARRALAMDPLSESALRVLVTALALDGERGAALEACDAFTARLAQSVGAEPSEATRRLTDRVRRERAWRASADRRPGAVSRRAPLVGRDGELATALQAWREARAGRAALVVLEGAPGCGRTRLMEELVARTRLDGAATVQVRATPGDHAEPWSGAYAVAASGLLAAGGIAAAAPQSLAAFATRLEDWGDRFPGARGIAARPVAGALADVVRAAAAEQPVVLAVDDAHWLDAESLESFHALLRDLERSPVLLLLTAEFHPPRDEIALLRSRVTRDVPGAALTINPLGASALQALARWAMPSWDAEAADRLARRLAADSAGLPLLAVELLHAVALGLDLEGTARSWPEPQRTLDHTRPGDLPETVVAAIRVGFRRLSPDAQSLLAAAAVLDDRVEERRLARASGLADSAFVAALDEAEWQRWLASDGRGYTFVARVAREVVARDMLTAGQRRRVLERA